LPRKKAAESCEQHGRQPIASDQSFHCADQ
jgi:hypothetical protein